MVGARETGSEQAASVTHYNRTQGGGCIAGLCTNVVVVVVVVV
jgi:hypothetical protein